MVAGDANRRRRNRRSQCAATMGGDVERRRICADAAENIIAGRVARRNHGRTAHRHARHLSTAADHRTGRKRCDERPILALSIALLVRPQQTAIAAVLPDGLCHAHGVRPVRHGGCAETAVPENLGPAAFLFIFFGRTIDGPFDLIFKKKTLPHSTFAISGRWCVSSMYSKDTTFRSRGPHRAIRSWRASSARWHRTCHGRRGCYRCED